MVGANFRPAERISGDKRFERLRREGAAAGDGLLLVRALANGRQQARLGLAVSRSSGGAVRRSRLRRMIREAFRLNKARLPRGLDLLVGPRAGAAGAGLPELGRSLVALARKAADKLGKPEEGKVRN